MRCFFGKFKISKSHSEINWPLKKKAEREKLKGFACDDCEQYYKNANLTNEQLQKLLQKCSKHRATIVPDPVSPKGQIKSEWIYEDIDFSN